MKTTTATAGKQGLKVDTTHALLSQLSLCVCVCAGGRSLKDSIPASFGLKHKRTVAKLLQRALKRKAEALKWKGIQWSQRQLPGQITFRRALMVMASGSKSESTLPKGQTVIIVIEKVSPRVASIIIRY